MKFEKFGYWIMNDVVKPIAEKARDEPEPDAEIFTDDPKVQDKLKNYGSPKKIDGKCTLSIRFNTEKEYQEWKDYFGGGRQWEFIVSFPAIMRAQYKFHNSLEAEVMVRKVVQLLESGFDVYSASWTLDKKEEETKYE